MEVVHLTNRADLNGTRGVATDYHSYHVRYPTDRTKDRYTVQFDSGEAFKVKPASVRAEGPGKAKGKGKKGRGGRK